MLHKDKILNLRDLALDHLPKVRAERDRMTAHGSIAALSAVAIAPLKTSHDVSSTAIEKRAAVLLHLVHQHPDTSTEWLIPSVDDSEKELEEVLMKDALRNQPMTEANMLENAKLLCELSGAPLPPWMTITPAAKVEAGTVATPTKTKKLAQTWWRIEYEIMTMAQSAGDSLRRKGKRTSNRAIGDVVAFEIEQREKSGKKRKAPDGETIKNTDLLGWTYEAE